MKIQDKEYRNHRVFTLKYVTLQELAKSKFKGNKALILEEDNSTTKALFLENYLDIPKGASQEKIDELIISAVQKPVSLGDNIVVKDKGIRTLLKDHFNIVRQEDDRSAVHLVDSIDIGTIMRDFIVYEYKHYLIFAIGNVSFPTLKDLLKEQYEDKYNYIINNIYAKEAEIIENAKLVYSGIVLKQYSNYHILNILKCNISGICEYKTAIRAAYMKKESLDLDKIKNIYSLITSKDTESARHGFNLLLSYDIFKCPYTILFILDSVVYRDIVSEYTYKVLETLNKYLYSFCTSVIDNEDKDLLEYILKEDRIKVIKKYIKEYTNCESDIELNIKIHGI